MTTRALLLSAATLLTALPAAAQDYDYEDEVIVATATRIGVTQSGVQDVAYFRETLELGELPTPASLTSEGLLSEYDLPLPSKEACEQLFCVSLSSQAAELPLRPEVSALIGVGFDSILADPARFKRAPVTLVMTVDTSGSMGGDPLETARAAMLNALERLGPGDRMGLVEYANGVEVVHPVADVVSARQSLRAAIEGLESGGSTAMEDGLKLGFTTARDAARDFDGTTRVMLFTDEQPNVGSQDPESFLGMAQRAAKDGIGLTTLGVSDDFGAASAARVAQADGANAFYLANAEAAAELFAAEFDYMLSEVARDLVLDIRAPRGVRIAEVFGVPGDGVDYTKRGVRMRVPSVFLSSQEGGLFLSVEGDPARLSDIEASVTYLDPRTAARGRHSAVATSNAAAAPAMRRAHRLVDQYTVMQASIEAGLFGDTIDGALRDIDLYLERLSAEPDEDMQKEAEMVSKLRSILSDHQDLDPEEPDYDRDDDMALLGRWEIAKVRSRSTNGIARDRIDLRRGDQVAFHMAEGEYEELMTFNARRIAPQGNEPRVESEVVLHDGDRSKLRLTKSELSFRYVQDGERLRLRLDDSDIEIILQRA